MNFFVWTCNLLLLVNVVGVTNCQGSSHHHRSRAIDETIDQKFSSFVPNKREQKFIDECLTGEMAHHRNSTKCNAMRSVAFQMRENSALNRIRRDIQKLQAKYPIALIMMNQPNGRHRYRNEMLDMVSSCSVYSNSVKEKWKKFFRIRTHSKNRNFESFNGDRITQQIVGDNEIEMELDMGLYNRSKYYQHQLVAADLSILRKSPCQMDEEFGKYELKVRQNINNAFKVVHRSKQSSCPTLDGYMMIADLDVESMGDWLLNSSEPLRLRINLTPQFQIFGGNRTKENGTSNILREVLSLHFLFKVGHAQPQNTYLDSQHGLIRKRRGLIKHTSSQHATSRCQRWSYPYTLETTENFIMLSPDFWDIGECLGRCDYPLSERMNSTNHGIVMSKQLRFNPTPPVRPTINCVPIEFRDLYHVHIITQPERVLQTGYVSKLQSTQCGCS